MALFVREKRVVETNNDVDGSNSTALTIANFVYILTGAVLSLLVVRIIFSLLGANRTNGFADFIYSLSQPLVAPFIGLFSIETQFGVSRLEIESVVAMIVYALLGWLLVRIVLASSDKVVE